jgi:hypothetical protein
VRDGLPVATPFGADSRGAPLNGGLEGQPHPALPCGHRITLGSASMAQQRTVQLAFVVVIALLLVAQRYL